MVELSVLVCDDVSRRGLEAVRGIQRAGGEAIRVDTRFGKNLEKEVGELFDQTVNPIMKTGRGKRTLFDEYDIVFVDSNLSEVQLGGFRLTAAAIVGYIRAFTRAKHVVTINRFPFRDFDLSDLSPNGGTPADLAINTKHLSSRWLWFRERESISDFCPWYWPVLAEAPGRRVRQLNDLEDLNSRVLQFFSFPKEAVLGLTNQACAQLDPTARNVSIVTFMDFYRKGCISLVPGEKDQLAQTGNSAPIRRIVAAELEAWLYKHILAPQAILVDVPHLVSRVPVLLGRKATAIDGWNETAASKRIPYGLSGTYYARFLRKWHFALSHWLPVPAFWWGPIRGDRQLDGKLMRMDNDGVSDLRFCEDVSLFLDGEVEEVTGFSADFRSTFNRRYVKRLPRVRYVPIDNLVD